MTSTEQLEAEAQGFKQDLNAIQKEVGKVIVGQERVIEATVTAILCGGNVLLEGVPGLGKTELVKALSRVLDLQFSRIQFTPDLMPADIVGTSVMSTDGSGHYQFEFRKGPIFTQLLLADEINRATPKTQSALLETMQEGTVTVPGETFHLEQPFFVLATQNPLEQEGTYPLPEAQLDRFLFKVEVPFPERADLNEIVTRTILRKAVPVEQVADGPKILDMRAVLDKVVVADPIRDYAVRLVLASHPQNDFAPPRVRQFIAWGASPRAVQAMIRAGRVRALAEGRAHLAFSDVRHFAREVLQHRMILNFDGQAEGTDMAELVTEMVTETLEEV